MSEEDEKKVSCPANAKWLKGMLDCLPKGLRGKLEPYEVCLTKKEE
jgi:hypothetical protein